MSITVKYGIDEKIYELGKNHKLLMETKQYIVENQILTKLTIYESLKAGLVSHMPELESRLQSHFYFLEDRDKPDNKQPIYQQYFQKLLKDVRSPSYTLTPKKWIETVNAIGLESKRGKNGGTMAHPFIACDFEIWNDMQFRYEVLKYFMSSRIETDDEENTD